MPKNVAKKGKPAPKKAAKRAKKSTERQLAPVYYRLHALLQTVRAVGQYEDQLCTLEHHLKQAGSLDGPAEAELRSLLDELPSGVLLQDLHAMRAVLEGAAAL